MSAIHSRETSAGLAVGQLVDGQFIAQGTAYWRLVHAEDKIMISCTPSDGTPPAIVTVDQEMPVHEVLAALAAQGNALLRTLFAPTPVPEPVPVRRERVAALAAD